MHFRALLATYLRMIHELDMVDQPHETEDGHGTKVLEGANGRVKTQCGNSIIQHICNNASSQGSQFLAFSKTIWITSPTPELVALICMDVEGPIHGPLAKINSSYQNKYVQKLLVMQKLKKNSLNKKSNCLLGEAMRVNFCHFLRNIPKYL